MWFERKSVIQWRPLNVITVNVIIHLMLSVFQRPAHFSWPTCIQFLNKLFLENLVDYKLKLLHSTYFFCWILVLVS